MKAVDSSLLLEFTGSDRVSDAVLGFADGLGDGGVNRLLQKMARTLFGCTNMVASSP